MRKSYLFGLTLGFASLGALVACSSTATSTPNGTDGGPVTEADGGGPTTQEDGGTPAGSAKTGSVTLTQSTFSAAGQSFTSYTAGAGFYNLTGTATGTTGDSTCTTTTEGTCTALVCPKATGETDAGTVEDAGAPATPPNAGDITVEALSTLTLSVDAASGLYAGKSGQTALFDTGGQIHISAIGADVPSFDDTFAAPPSITLTSPVVPTAPAKLTINGGAQLDLAWTGGAAGSVETLITAADATSSTVVTCTFDASTGSATVPASIMAKLAKGDGAFLVSTQTVEALKAGDYDVSLKASASAATSTSTVQ